MGKVMLTLVVVLLGLSAVKACWPAACISPEILRNKTCCPFYRGSRCGMSLGRGECLYVTRPQQSSTPGATQDHRSSWPFSYYNATCFCKGNFYGIDCSDCITGFTGQDCTTPLHIERQDITQLSLKKRKEFMAALNYCKRKVSTEYMILFAGDRLSMETYQFRAASYYDVLVFSDYYAQRPLQQGNRFVGYDFAYGSSGFLTGNRARLLFAEYMMRLCTKNEYFVFPYYDHTLDDNCTICNNQFMGESNEDGELHSWSAFSTWRATCAQYDHEDQYCYMSECICQRAKIYRNPGYNPQTYIPRRAEVLAILKIRNYDTDQYDIDSLDSFRNAMEGHLNPYDPNSYSTSMNYMWHQYHSGTMGEFSICANDPMHWLQVAFMDKLFEIWVNANNATPSTYPPNTKDGHMGSSYIVPIIPITTHREQMVSSKMKHRRSYSFFRRL